MTAFALPLVWALRCEEDENDRQAQLSRFLCVFPFRIFLKGLVFLILKLNIPMGTVTEGEILGATAATKGIMFL